MIKFRGHHLICLHFFKGEGYSEEFVQNLSDLITRANANETIIVTQGADDVCKACPYLEESSCKHKPDSEEQIRKLDDSALRLLGLNPGQIVIWHEIRSQVDLTPKEWFSSFCADCEWKS
jgi:hypothetical protein